MSRGDSVKSTISTISAICLISLASTAGASDKLDAFFDLTETGAPIKAMGIGANAIADTAAIDIAQSLFIKSVRPDETRTAIVEMGGQVHMIVGQILTATIPTSMIAGLAEMDAVQFVEADKPLQRKSDVAGTEIGVTEIHAGTAGLPVAFTGKNVVVGVIDTGIDYTHPDFRDADGNNRILSIWDQNRGGGPTPEELEFSFGTECDSASITDGICPLFDSDGHGTHVSGIAASRNEAYRGVAPDANIIVVSYDSSLELDSGYANPIFSTKICQAAYYIFTKADELGLPAVINLSLGTHIGPHDGTSLFEECLSGLIQGSAGRAIVAAAGNEHTTDTTYTGIHAGGDIDGTSATNFEIREITSDRIYYIDFWGTSGSDLSAGLAVRSGSLDDDAPVVGFTDLIAPGDRRSGSLLDGKIRYVINARETASALNGKPHIGVRIILDSSFQNVSNYSFDLVVKGQGHFDAWLFPDKPAATVQFTSTAGTHAGSDGATWTYLPGDRQSSVAVPATARDIIAVAGYASRTQWEGGPGCCRVSHQLDDLLSFSSAGPSADPAATGSKPDIAAPGGMIASTLSGLTTPNSLLMMSDGAHFLMAGTSMAAPFVTGTIALMFSADPNYTHTDVKRFLLETAYVDEKVSGGSADRWGAGKLDALAAMELALQNAASGSFDANEGLAPPDSAGGAKKAGCTLSPAAPFGNGLEWMLIGLALTPIAIASRRRKRAA